MPVRRLRAFAVVLTGAIVATVLSVTVAPQALALDPPTNPSPSGAQTGIPTFSWDRVDGATTYDFQISTSDQFTTTLVSATTVQRQYVPKIQLPTATQLYWRVRATGGGETWTTTPFLRNTVGAPTLIGPADAAQLTQPDNPVTLSWQPVPGAASYDVQYGTDPNFVDQTTTTNVKASSFVVPLQTPGTYVWRVRGVLANGVFTAWSGGTSPLPPARTYQVMGLANSSSIPPTSPPDDPNQALTDVVLDWEPINGAKSYQIQISTDQLFPANTIVDSQNTVYGTRYSPPKTLNNDQYFWRIRPTDAAGFQPDWASRPVWRFKRTWPDQTTLLYPANNATNIDDPMYYQWTPIKHASLYTVSLYSSSTLSGASFVGSCSTIHTTVVYGNDGGDCWPAAGGTYWWRVTATDEFSSDEPITDAISAPVGKFTFASHLVTTTGPASGTHFADVYDPNQLDAPVLSWEPVAGAEKYRVTITGASTVSVDVPGLSYAPTQLDAGSYTWDVRTVDHQGAVGAGHLPGSQRTFVVNQPPKIPDPDHPGQFILLPVPEPLPASGPPNPLSSDLGASFRVPTFVWSPVSWVDYYTIFVGPHGLGTFQPLPGQFEWAAGNDNAGKYLEPGQYDWFVVAHRKDGATLQSSQTSTFTIKSLPDIPIESYRAALTGNALRTGADVCNLKLPSNCQNLRQTPVLGWDSPDPEVGYYQIQFSKDAELTNPIGGPSSIASTMYLDASAVEDSQAGSAYFVVVVPCTAFAHCAPIGHATHSYNKMSRPATLISPAPGAQVENDVTLTWDDYIDSQKVVDGADPDLGTPIDTPGQDEAEYYQVQTASDQNFTQGVTTTKVDQTTFTSFADTYPEGTTWWRVQAVDRDGNTLAWSTPRSFLKQSPTPQLLLPNDGDTVPGDYTLSWQAQPYAASYDIEVYKGGDTSGNTVNRVINASTDRVQYVLTNLDPSSGPYAWRVRRHDGKNRLGAWSAFRTFNVTRPGVTLISPADNDTVPPSDQLFQWQPVQGATSYKFERRPGTSGSATETVDTPTTKWAPTAAIAGGSWQWRVTAYDTANNLIADSSWLHPFTVVDTPVATVPVSITGSGVVDSTLTLNPAQWNMPNNVLTITYQWFRGTSAVTGATGVTYDVTSADVGKAITVKATATRPGYKTGTSTSNAITGTQAGAPLASTPVVITGTGFYGSTLQLTPPTWDIGGVTTTYQWFRDTSAVSGQTGTSYVVGASDMGKSITVKATGTKTGYVNGTSVSNAIAAALNPAPAATTPIALSGGSPVGSVLTMTPPTWDTAGVTVTYQWFRDATAFTNAATTYTTVSGDVGKTITVKATATKTGYANGVSTSNGILVTQASAVTPTTMPSITGVPAAKEKLTADVGVWPGSGSKTYAYQWFVNGQAVATETGKTYTVRTRDAGLPVTVRVTMSMSGFAPSVATSAPVAIAKLKSETVATLAKTKISQRQRAVLTVQVALIDFGVPLGQVQVKDGTKVIAITGLQTGKNGELKIRLKKLKAGKHKLVVSYLGSVSTAASTAKTVTLKVIKPKKK
jgi:large repetitive protein